MLSGNSPSAPSQDADNDRGDSGWFRHDCSQRGCRQCLAEVGGDRIELEWTTGDDHRHLGEKRFSADIGSPDKYEWCYLYAAVEPATASSAALIAPNVDTGTMNQFLKILEVERKPDEHIVLIMDGAGWHKSKAIKLPAGITGLAAASRTRRN